jgi:hypothetical protein
MENGEGQDRKSKKLKILIQYCSLPISVFDVAELKNH